MVSFGVVKLKANLGIVITASHNPPSYNGYKLKSSHGGPCIPSEIDAVESHKPEKAAPVETTFETSLENGRIKLIDLEQMYIDHIEANFDLAAIRNSSINLAYDAMYGAGQNVIRCLFPKAHVLHCEFNPSFKG
jgi:phosphomannomutase